jgi:hypothetical protein
MCNEVFAGVSRYNMTEVVDNQKKKIKNKSMRYEQY